MESEERGRYVYVEVEGELVEEEERHGDRETKKKMEIRMMLL